MAWTLRTVASILDNPRYTGRQVWNRQRTDAELANPADVRVGVARERKEPSAVVPDTLHAQAAEEFADEVTAGCMRSIRVIRARLHVGQSRADYQVVDGGGRGRGRGGRRGRVL